MITTLHLRRDAPPKPAEGDPCNGCGVCCAMARCPMSLLFLPPGKAPCVALEWHDGRYVCGLVLRPGHYVRWLPRRWQDAAGRWFAFRICAGSGCDCGATEAQ